MKLDRKPRRALVFASDYGGSDPAKALSEEGIATVLVSPNIATLDTGPQLAERVYLAALTPHLAETLIAKERVDAIMLAFGGSTALSCGLALSDAGVLAKHGVQVLGTPVETIRDTQDRRLLAERLAEIGVQSARSRACATPQAAQRAIAELGLPVTLRAGYAPGDKGRRVVRQAAEVGPALQRAFAAGVAQVLVEECLEGWKQIEYEVMRDATDNCAVVCSMEDLDPVGMHSGGSIVVAPCQTLDEAEQRLLRSVAIRAVRHLGILGACSIRFALSPGAGYRVIEVGACYSRSSRLASRTTGCPLAYVAARLALGHALPGLPAPGRVVCTFPCAATGSGSEMQAVGEVMAVGSSFAEAIQKAVRMLDIGVPGLDPDAFGFDDLRDRLRRPAPLRMFAVAQALRDGIGIDEIHALTRIDRWFLHAVESIVEMHRGLGRSSPSAPGQLREAKRLGFSDDALAALTGSTPEKVRDARKTPGSEPRLAPTSTRKKILIVGSGAYRIGPSMESAGCTVNAVQAACALGYDVITLSHLEEISFETVLDSYEAERPEGVVLTLGGPLERALALRLAEAGVPLLATGAGSILAEEERAKFSSLLGEIAIDEPHAREIEFDGVAARGEIVLWALCEHREHGGVHGGDASAVPLLLGLGIAATPRVRQIAAALARTLEITGAFNLRFLVRHNVVNVVECNLSASRSLASACRITGQALQRALRAAGTDLPRKGVLLSLDPVAHRFSDEARIIAQEALTIYATPGTAQMLADIGIGCTPVDKGPGGPSGLEVIEQGLVGLVISVPRQCEEFGRSDCDLIRRQAIASGVALITHLPFARAVIEALHSGRAPAPGVLNLAGVAPVPQELAAMIEPVSCRGPDETG